MDPWVVLKREYLDRNQSSNSKSALNVQGISRGTLANPYEQKLTATSQQQSVQTISSFGGGNKLSGQGWYDQSAMRAVNQALGRVIRHMNDWGAVFLLDSRFQQSNRINQLSKWVRHRVISYKTLAPALQDFRTFATSAMQDPDLNITCRVKEVQKDTSFPRYIPPAPVDIAEEKEEHRHIIIPAKAFGLSSASSQQNSGEVVFIDPSLLMTQNSEPLEIVDINTELGSFLQDAELSQRLEFDKNKEEKPLKSLFDVLGQKSASAAPIKKNVLSNKSWPIENISSSKIISDVKVPIMDKKNTFGLSNKLNEGCSIDLTNDDSGTDIGKLNNETSQNSDIIFLHGLRGHISKFLSDNDVSMFLDRVSIVLKNRLLLESLTEVILLLLFLYFMYFYS